MAINSGDLTGTPRSGCDPERSAANSSDTAMPPLRSHGGMESLASPHSAAALQLRLRFAALHSAQND